MGTCRGSGAACGGATDAEVRVQVRGAGAGAGGEVGPSDAARPAASGVLDAPATRLEEEEDGYRPGVEPDRRAPLATAIPNPANDDRDAITEGDTVVLIVENDLTFAGILLEMARGKGFRGLVALDGRTGIDLAHQYRPTRSPSTSTCRRRRLRGARPAQGAPGHAAHPGAHHQRLERRHEGPLGRRDRVPREAGERRGARRRVRAHRGVPRPARAAAARRRGRRGAAHRHRGAHRPRGRGDHGVASAEAALAALGERPFDCVVLDLGSPARAASSCSSG
jgi:hypothetical protein